MADRMMTRQTNADLEQRIAAAFADTAKSEDFSDLIAAAELAAKAANAKAARAKERALDPTCPQAEVATARREMEDAAFVSDRMQVAATRLRDRHRAVAATEENARRLLAYNEAITARDELAKELAQLYPSVAAQLADLMNRIATSDREINYINAGRLPDGAGRILEAELIAREMLGFVSNGVEALSIIRELRLPAFRFDPHAPYTWPGSPHR